MPDPLVHCQRCPDTMPPPQLLEHVRLMHPDVEDVEPVETSVADLVQTYSPRVAWVEYWAGATLTEWQRLLLTQVDHD